MLHHTAEVLLLINPRCPTLKCSLDIHLYIHPHTGPINDHPNVAKLCHIWQVSMNETAGLPLLGAAVDCVGEREAWLAPDLAKHTVI